MKKDSKKLKNKLKELLEKLRAKLRKKIQKKIEEKPLKLMPRKEEKKKEEPIKKEKPEIKQKVGVYQPKPAGKKRYDKEYPEKDKEYQPKKNKFANYAPSEVYQQLNSGFISNQQYREFAVPLTYFPKEFKLHSDCKLQKLENTPYSPPHSHHHTTHNHRPCGGVHYSKYHQELAMMNPPIKYSQVLAS